MSIIFGICREYPCPVEESELRDMASMTHRHARHGCCLQIKNEIGMGIQPFYTHQRSLLEHQPLTDESGNMLVLDGRLDNYQSLQQTLCLGSNTSDSLIVLSAFRRWGEECFSRFIGDWALVLWNKGEKTLYMARDHAGTRALYYQHTQNVLRWATHLEMFFYSNSTAELDTHYVSAYLTCLPPRTLTPYQNIHSVLPAHYLVIHGGKIIQKEHWHWIPYEKIHYVSDAEYEQHFLSLFRQSVSRRTGPGAPILAQLSGGMDSTAIVSISDELRHAEGAEPLELLDTISFFDPSEPDWDEAPYFLATETLRGKAGIHVRVSHLDRDFTAPAQPTGSMQHLWNGYDSGIFEQEQRIQQALGNREYRVILSGLGGDELLGGVPTPIPELADHLFTLNIGRFLRSLVDWSLVSRAPLHWMLLRTLRYIVQCSFPYREQIPDVPWLSPLALGNARELCRKDVTRRWQLGCPPSTIGNSRAWWSVLESLPHLNPETLVRYEYRYPYLDRDLVDFLLRVPRGQLLRPGRRRSLMRRALREIVPGKILERPRKGYIAKTPLLALRNAKTRIEELFTHSLSASHGFLDEKALRSHLELLTEEKTNSYLPQMVRAITLELWLRNEPQVTIANSKKILPRNSERDKLHAQSVAS